MKSRAFDPEGVVHMTDFKGAPFASCFDTTTDVEESEAKRVSPMFLHADEPITCMKCLMVEAARSAPPDKSDDDDD